MTEHRNSLPATVTSLALFAGAIVLVNLPLQSGSYDDRSCDSLLQARNQVWELQNSCGVGWFGTLAVTIAIVTIAVEMLAVSLLVQRGRLPGRTAYWLMLVAAIGSICCASAIAIRAAAYPDNPVRRGWVSLRNLTIEVALGITVVTLVLRNITSRLTRESPTDEVADE
jgi:hypothetical protein